MARTRGMLKIKGAFSAEPRVDLLGATRVDLLTNARLLMNAPDQRKHYWLVALWQGT